MYTYGQAENIKKQNLSGFPHGETVATILLSLLSNCSSYYLRILFNIWVTT